jgi:NAD(P)-dependent dehydrogenase (short-subunit alcohol dehydrogenase family)
MNKVKVYVITGGGHFPGIGSCLAEKLLTQQHKVVVNSRTFDSRWTELAAKFPDNLCMVPGDITDPEIQHRLLETAMNRYKRIDVLVNNASSVKIGTTPDRDEWNREFMMNVIVPYELCMQAKDYMQSSNDGSVIMIGSRFAMQVADTKNPAYSIAKAALHQLTKNLSVTLAPIRVNTVAPGMFESARWKQKFAGQEDILRDRFDKKSLSRRGTISADALADSIIFLANNEYITGQILPVCAGTSVARV